MTSSAAPQTLAGPQPSQVVILLTGIQAAGKSTVAQLLAERCPGRYTCEATCSGA